MKREIDQWFVSPNAENKAYVTEFFEKITAQLIQSLSTASERELVPQSAEAQSFIAQLEAPHTLEQALEKLQAIYNQSMNGASIGYIGQMDSIPNLGAIAGDLVTAAINNNMLANEMSPILSKLEVEVVRQFADWFGFGEKAGGIMASGGTLANIQALTVARNTILGIPDGNLFHIKKQPVIFASAHAHASITKAGMLLGIGSEGVIKVKTDEKGRMDMAALRTQVQTAIDAGQWPFAVVSTYGTTNAGALDDVDAVQALCDELGLWHHIDAIYGGAVVLSNNLQHLFPAFHKANSLSFNPQKWMYVSKTCSLLIFRSYSQLETHFKIAAPYVKDGDNPNLGEYGIQGSRHASVLKLWLSLYLIGKQQYANIIDLNMEISQAFVAFIEAHPHLQLYTQPDLNIILFRPKKPAGLPEKDYKQYLTAFQEYLYAHNRYISLIPWEGELWLKCIFLNPYFNHDSLEGLKQLIGHYFSKSK